MWFAKATPNHSPDAASSARDLRQRGKDICRPETQHAKGKLRGQQCLFGLKICYRPEALMQKSILGACSSRLEAGHSIFMHFRHASSIAPQGRQCCENNSDASVCPCRAACCEAFMPSESLKSCLARASSSRRAAWTWPLQHACIKGVLPLRD